VDCSHCTRHCKALIIRVCVSSQLFRHLVCTDDGVCSVCRKHVAAVAHYRVPQPELRIFYGVRKQKDRIKLEGV
jgi:hypothetical protein